MVEITWNSIPPSVNKLYFNRQGRRILSAEGRAWKNRFIQQRGGLSVMEAEISFEPEDRFCLELTFFFPKDKIYSKGWGKDKRCKSPFKRMDVSNLIKLAEDALSELLGLDDRANFKIIAEKKVCEEGKDAWMKMKLKRL